jgi:tripartite ATP-independent transporter DctP family solute receptor
MFRNYIFKKWYSWIVLPLACLVLLTFGITGVLSAAPKVMKVAYPFGATPDHPHYYIGDHLKKRVTELTKGEVEVKLYPQSQLGGDRETIEGVINGTIEMSWPASAPMALVIPEIGALDLPYIFKDEDHAARVLNGKGGKLLEAKCLAKGMRVGGWGNASYRQILTTKKPIYKIEDLQGLKIRVMEAPIFIEMLKAWGAKPTPVSWPEVYMALSQGVVDGQEATISGALSMNHFEVIRYAALTNDSLTIRPMIISEKWWKTLQYDIQEAILKATREAAAMMFKKLSEYEKEALGIAKEKHKITITEPDLKPFQDTKKVIYPKIENVVGGKEIINAIQASE